MPVGNTPVYDVGEGGGIMVHGHMGDVLKVAEKTDPLPGLQSRSYPGIDEVPQKVYEWYGYINLTGTVCLSVRQKNNAGI